ncbi:MAG: hypothetical protein NO117_02930 [Sulfolobales archaeon]|nr:hypothetical protein [Sulfolobales archaeon]
MRPEECKHLECVEEVLRSDLGIAKKITLGEGRNSPARVEGDEIIIDVMRLDSFQAETGGEAGLVSAYITAAVLYALYGTAEAIEISKKKWGDSLVVKVLETYFR